MKTEARQLGATHVVNVRLETASLSEDWSGSRPMFSAEFIAYGTALVPQTAKLTRPRAPRARGAPRDRRVLADRSVDLAANLAAGESHGRHGGVAAGLAGYARMHVGVGGAGAHGSQELRELPGG